MRVLDQPLLFEQPKPHAASRVVCWFSCGAASAVAAKLSIEKYGDRAVIVYTDPKGEHPDNERFLDDCERWFGQDVIRLSNRRYRDPWHVMEQERYIVGPDGAKCTGEMKKSLRFRFQRPDDIQVFAALCSKRTKPRCAVNPTPQRGRNEAGSGLCIGSDTAGSISSGGRLLFPLGLARSSNGSNGRLVGAAAWIS